MKSIHLLLLTVVIISNVNAQKSIFDTGIENTRKLPALEIRINEDEIAKAFLSKQIYASTESSNDYVYKNQSAIFYEDPKINDTKNFFERYLKQDLFTPSAESKGSVEMKVLFYEYQFDITPGFGCNVMSFGITGLLGLPSERYRSEVEIEMSVYDIHGNLIANYYSSGKDDYHKNLYRKRISDRESNLRALRNAIKNLNELVMREYESINDKLTAANMDAMN